MPGMNRHDERGATLVEAMVAGSLLVTLAAGAATLILLGHTLGIQTEQSMTATALATARLEALRAIPWDYGSGGVAPDVPALAPSPSTVLDASTSGYSETLDDSGRPHGTGRFETLAADTVILALGQESDTGFLRTVHGVGYSLETGAETGSP